MSLISGNGNQNNQNIGNNNSGVIGDNNTIINAFFFVNSQNQALDASGFDSMVVPKPFNGGLSQQWVLAKDGDGLFSIKSIFNQMYAALNNTSLGSGIVLAAQPFKWKISRRGGVYQILVPNSGLAISLGNLAVLALSSDVSTQIYVIQNTPQNQTAILSGSLTLPECAGWWGVVSGNVYKITNVVFTQHVVEYMLPSWQTTSIGARPYTSLVNQKWILEKNGTLWAIRSFIMNNLYLAPGTTISTSIPARQYYSSKGAVEALITTTPFYWKIEQTGASQFRIRDPVTNKCLFLADNRVGATQAEYFYPVYVIPQTNARCEFWTIESV